LFEDKVTVTLAEPAGTESVTVPVTPLPAVTVVGLTVTPARPACDGCVPPVMVRTAVTELAEVAVMFAEVLAETAEVAIGNVPDTWPGATVRVVGTVAAGLFEDSDTVTPPGPAGAISVTVPVEEAPPVRLLGAMLSCEITPCVPAFPLSPGPDGAVIVSGASPRSDSSGIRAVICTTPAGAETSVTTRKLADD